MGPHLALCQLYPLAIPGARGVRMRICISNGHDHGEIHVMELPDAGTILHQVAYSEGAAYGKPGNCK